MLQQAVAVELITHEHRYSATIYTRGQRLLDMLNDRTSDFLQINDASVYRYSALENPIANFANAVIRKADLHLAIIAQEEREATAQRLFGFVQKSLYHVFLTVPGYEVRGTLHLLADHEPNPIAVLKWETGTFFPVTDASITDAWRGEQVFQFPVVMVNKDSLSLFHLSEEPLGS